MQNRTAKQAVAEHTAAIETVLNKILKQVKVERANKNPNWADAGTLSDIHTKTIEMAFAIGVMSEEECHKAGVRV